MEKEGEASITRGKRMEEERGMGEWKGFGRMRAGEEEKRTWKHAWRTRADVSIHGTGWHAGHACTYTRVYVRHTYIHTYMEDTHASAERVRARARAIRGMRPGLNYVPRNAFSRESHCERSV